MSKLEELVPDMKLCKLIPVGEFEDTALVWLFVDGEHFVAPRGAAQDNISLPAPTPEEIMAKLRQDYIKVGTFIRSYWGCYIIDNYGDEIAEVDDNSPATAALKLWLKLKGIKYEKD